MNKVISFENVKEKQDQEQREQTEKAYEFTFQAWNVAVEHSRFLPQKMAIKLIEQIVYDHGIRADDLKSFI